MCDAEKLLQELKPRQVKPKTLQCTADHKCWCNNVSFRCGHNPLPDIDDCWSPKEMLELFGDELNQRDKKYLQSLVHRQFQSIGELIYE